MKKDGAFYLIILLLTGVLFTATVFFTVSDCTDHQWSHTSVQVMTGEIQKAEQEGISLFNILPQIFVIVEQAMTKNLIKNQTHSHEEEEEPKKRVIWDSNSWSIIVK